MMVRKIFSLPDLSRAMECAVVRWNHYYPRRIHGRHHSIKSGLDTFHQKQKRKGGDGGNAPTIKLFPLTMHPSPIWIQDQRTKSSKS